jgi:hypothetical protein
MATGRGNAWAGWIAFAATMLLIISGINIFQGIVALVDDEHVVATADSFVLVDITSWGWTVLIWGVVMFAVGLGLLAGMTWARVVGIIVVGLNAVAQVAWLGGYPVWSLLMIALDTIVLFALTARWSAARGALRDDENPAVSADAMPGDTSYGNLPHEATPYQRQIT